nr:F-box protein CPR30-like [Ipomoea trifida]
MGFDILPTDLWVEVLARLPTKSIIRFATVSKSFYSLIKTPHFISKHLEFNSSISCILFFLRGCDKKGYNMPHEEMFTFYYDDGQNLSEFVKFKAPFESPENLFFRIVGCCNGVIFLCDDYFQNHHTLILWNPFLGRWVSLPEPSNLVHFRYSFGFGFDAVEKDYKVLSILDVGPPENANGLEITPSKVQILRLKKRVWEYIPNVFPFSIPGRSSQACVNGAVHWVGKQMLDGKVKNVMVRFDLSKEQFGRIGLPENVATLPCICVAAEVYLELLAVVAVDMNSRYSIWTMKEYDRVESWTKQVSFIFPDSGYAVPFGFRGNGDIQVMRTRGRSYGEWKAVDPEGRPCNYGYYYMFGENHKLVNSCYASPFVESLAFLDASTDFDDAPVQNLPSTDNDKK